MDNTEKRFFTASDGMKNEYCAKIVRIGEMRPIEGSDFLVQTSMDGFSCVVSKGAFQVGEPVIYCLNETAINKQFLAANNQFEIGEFQMNANAKEVGALIAEGKKDEAKRMVGFFNKNGRVRMIRLRGCPSYGCIFKVDSLVRWMPKLAGVDLESYFTVDENGYEHPFNFDTIDGTLFAEVYIPQTRGSKRSMSQSRKKNKGQLFDRLVPGQFVFHYDTDQLRDNMWRFSPDTKVSISVKQHGTSVIIGNLVTRVPTKLNIVQSLTKKNVRHQVKHIEKQFQRFPWQRNNAKRRIEKLNNSLPETFRLAYGPVFSSRTVVKNQYETNNPGPGFYDVDIWSEYGVMLYKYIPKGITVYGEICGYLTGVSQMVQKQYDYGCHPGENYMMPYRITQTDADGSHREWSTLQVRQWTVDFMEQHPDVASRLRPMTILYHGTLADLYPHVAVDEHWRDHILECLANDSAHFGMEKNEPLCKNKVPREGLVLRIDNDPVPQAFKLKSNLFFERESKLIDKGEVDVEVQS